MEKNMKKICTLAVLSVFAYSSAFAGGNMHNNMNHNNMNHNNGMTNATITTVVEPVMDTVVTVSQIPSMGDDQNVVMTGYLIEDLGEKMYVFQDSTGTITVEIEPVILGEMVIMPDTKMKIKGQVDKGEGAEPDIIEVDYITTM